MYKFDSTKEQWRLATRLAARMRKEGFSCEIDAPRRKRKYRCPQLLAPPNEGLFTSLTDGIGTILIFKVCRSRTSFVC